MEYLISVGYILGWLFVVVCCRFITTTIHELGHAIPSLRYTDGQVKMHVGSYGDEKSKHLRFGRLTAYFKLNPLRLNIGLCQSEKAAATIGQAIRIVLGGPIASLLLGLIILVPLSLIRMPYELVMILMALMLSAVWDFFVNMVPMEQSIQLQNGKYTYNDGQQLLYYLQLRKYPLEFHKATTYYEEGDYQSAIVNFRKVIEAGAGDKGVYSNLIHSLIMQRNYRSALHCCEEMDLKYKLKPEDFVLVAYVFMKNGNHSKAIECLDQSIYYNFNDANAYNNRGYSFLMLEQYDRAEADFRMAIRHNPTFGFPYNNLGLVYLRKGETDQVLPLIERSRELNPDNPHLFLHLGYYYQEIGDYNTALNNFEVAKQDNIDFEGIDALIAETQEALKKNSV